MSDNLTTGQFAEIGGFSQQTSIRLVDAYETSIKELMPLHNCSDLQALRAQAAAHPDGFKNLAPLVRLVLIEQLPPPFRVAESAFRRIPYDLALRYFDTEGRTDAVDKLKALASEAAREEKKPSLLKPIISAKQKDYGTNLTTGDMATLANVAARTVSKWLDECNKQLTLLKEQHNCGLSTLQAMFRNSPHLFDQGALGNLALVILEGAPPVYHIPGSRDRRIPRETAIRFFRNADMLKALAHLETPPQHGVLFVIPRTGLPYTDIVMNHLDERYCCASVNTGLETGLAMEQMRQQNGAYPAIIIAHDALGEFELKALASRVKGKAPLIAIAWSEENAIDFRNSGIPAEYILVEGENGLRQSQIERMLWLIEPSHRAQTVQTVA